MHSQKYKNLLSGFTLLEMMIVIVIVGIMAAIAFPGYTDMVKNNCLTSQTNSLVTYLQLARSEAVKRQEKITVEPKDDDWSTGWKIKDAAGNVIKTLTNTSCLVTTVTSNANAFTYISSGFITAAGTLTICDDRTGERGRQIVINIVGRPKAQFAGCS